MLVVMEKAKAGVLLHYLRPETTNPVSSCSLWPAKVEWKMRTRDSDQSICNADRTSEQSK